MTLSIEVNAQPVTDPKWGPWVKENGLGLCFRLVAMNEALTAWQGDFYVDDERTGKITMHPAVGVVTLTRAVTTTPADPRWLTPTFGQVAKP